VANFIEIPPTKYRNIASRKIANGRADSRAPYRKTYNACAAYCWRSVFTLLCGKNARDSINGMKIQRC